MSKEVCQSLIMWLNTVCSAGSTGAGWSAAEMCDGVAICQALVRIAPETFAKLEPKVKADVANNWLKIRNLKKVYDAIMEYLEDTLNLNILDACRPDLQRLGETNDLIQLGKLLRLVLVCAVNCERKQQYITQIRHMEETVQQCIMLAIQQLDEVTGGGNSGSRSLQEAKEQLAQRCHNLEAQMATLKQELVASATECKSLRKQLRERDRTAEAELELNLNLNRSPAENRRQIDQLNEEIFKVETMRDDYRAKVLEQERQIFSLQDKVAELQRAAEVNARLKDEVDALSESADKVQALEIQVASYKKKLEDFTDTKRQLRQLEEKNVQYIQQTMQYEEELKKHVVWRSQSDMYKAESVDLQQKLDEEIGRVDKLTFQFNNAETKLAIVIEEKERLLQERNLLREENEELRAVGADANGDVVVARELTPTEMKERLRFLESENITLRSSKQELDAKGALLEDRTNRLERLTEQNRSINQRVLSLEAQLEDAQQQKSGGGTASLQEALNSKEQELAEMQTRYNRYLEKVGEVAMTIDAVAAKSNGTQAAPKSAAASSTTNTNTAYIMKEMEGRLMTSAFYKLSLRCHREAVDDRLAMLSAGQGQSFLSRQRQPVPRKQAPAGSSNSNAISISNAGVASAATSMPFRSK